MANITAIRNLQNLSQYMPDGIAAAMEGILRFMPAEDKLADSYTIYAYPSISTTKQEIDDDAGSIPLVFVAKSGGTLCYIHFHNVDADSVTAGVDANFVVPVAGTSGELTCIAAFGASWRRFWDTGLTVSASTTVEASAAPTNLPDIFVLLKAA
jgi:hypothetical protein